VKGRKVKYAFEEVLEEVSQLKTPEETIALAVEREKEAKNFYLEKAASSEDAKLKDLYAHLADEEAKHIEYLEKYRKTKQLPIVKSPIPAGQSFIPEFTENDNKLGPIAVLLAALRHERKSEYFYSEMAKQTEDESRKKFFELLAGYERVHYELIDNYIEAITEFRMQT
jgi:rubrerythrin